MGGGAPAWRGRRFVAEDDEAIVEEGILGRRLDAEGPGEPRRRFVAEDDRAIVGEGFLGG